MSQQSQAWAGVAAACALVLLLAPSARAQQPAGTIKTVTGTAFVVRNGEDLRAGVGQPVFEGDSLKTAADGRLGITLKDGTRLSLGGGTELQIRAFAFAPAGGRLGLALKILRGAAEYISGRIADLAPASVKIETPTSIIGVRGTRLLVGVDQP